MGTRRRQNPKVFYSRNAFEPEGFLFAQFLVFFSTGRVGDDLECESVFSPRRCVGNLLNSSLDLMRKLGVLPKITCRWHKRGLTPLFISGENTLKTGNSFSENNHLKNSKTVNQSFFTLRAYHKLFKRNLQLFISIQNVLIL